MAVLKRIQLPHRNAVLFHYNLTYQLPKLNSRNQNSFYTVHILFIIVCQMLYIYNINLNKAKQAKPKPALVYLRDKTSS
jgi:hypothetical protein